MKYPSFLLFICLSINGLHAQERELIRGIVVDSATFAPLPYVNIRIKGTLMGTSSDDQGNFSLLATRNDTLALSFVGYNKLTIPLLDWEPSVVRMSEDQIMLNTVIIRESRLDPYEGMFDAQNAKRDDRSNPFYYSRAKKEKNKLAWLREDNQQAKVYLDVVINRPETKKTLMAEFNLSEKQYYDLLLQFNINNHHVMYYLTAGELLSLLKRFYVQHACK